MMRSIKACLINTVETGLLLVKGREQVGESHPEEAGEDLNKLIKTKYQTTYEDKKC